MSRLTIRAQIAIFAGLLGVMLVAAMAGVAMYLAERRDIQVAKEKMVGLADSMAESLDRGMFERYREIKNIAGLETLSDAWTSHPEELRSTLEMLQRSFPDYAWIGFARPDGSVHAATGGLLQGVDVSERPWFQGGAQQPFVGDVHEAKLLAGLLRPRDDGEPFRFVDVAAPVRDAAGQFAGVLGAHLSWTWAADLKRSLVTPELAENGTDVWIVSSNGVVLLGPASGTQMFTPERAAQLVAEGSGSFLDSSFGSHTFTGFAVANGFRDYPGLNWIVLARQPTAIAYGVAHRRVMKTALIGTAMALLGLALSVMIGGRLGRPILLLTQEADRIGRDPDATMFPRVTGSREVEQLSAALRSLLRRVGDAEQRMVESERQRAIEGRRYSADVDQLRRLADTDPLTGLLNRRSFERNAMEAMEHFRRNGRPFAVLVLDIDHFKRVNDTYGHAAGDEVIQHVANILAHQIRVPDRIARVGGEEFLALVHEVRADDALALAERLRSEVESAYVCRDKEIIKVTVSIGLSVALERDRDIEDVVARADAGLYEAKAKGRNRSLFRAGDNLAESEARAA